jgi:hypothetical protein
MADILLNCRFCQGELLKKEISGDEHLFICSRHPVKTRFVYRLYPDAEDSYDLTTTSLGVIHNDKHYSFRFCHLTQTFSLKQIRSCNEFCWMTVRRVLFLDYLPNITPSNALQKLPTLLTFS